MTRRGDARGERKGQGDFVGPLQRVRVMTMHLVLDRPPLAVEHQNEPITSTDCLTLSQT